MVLLVLLEYHPWIGAHERSLVAPDGLRHDEPVLMKPAEVSFVEVVARSLPTRTGQLHSTADLD